MKELQRHKLINTSHGSSKFYSIVIEHHDDKTTAPYFIKGEYGKIGREHAPSITPIAWYDTLAHAKTRADAVYKDKSKKGYVLETANYAKHHNVRVATSRFDLDDE